MPSSLNADNGVVSGTAGLKSSADNSGVLDLQTNGTTAISISASQVVTFANQPAYTGGTANGVLYLNGSKVLTSGSALTFDGSQLDIPLGSAAAPSLSTPTDPNTGMFFPTADTIAFAEGGVEAMRLDINGNLLLGATSQNGTTSRLYLKQSVDTGFRGVNVVSADVKEWVGSFSILSDGVLNIAQSYLGGTGAYQPISFTTGVSERMRLDTSGNLGIGTTGPDAKLQVAGNATIGNYVAATNVSLNFNGVASKAKRIIFKTSGTESWLIGMGAASETDAFEIYNGNGQMALSFAKATSNATFVSNIGVGNATPTTSGTGITFPATQSASADANTLDDYEEGTWTPTLNFDIGGTGIVYGTRQGTYTKIGRVVTIAYYIEIASGVSGSDYFCRLTLPFSGVTLIQDTRVKQWNSSLPNWALSLGGSNPVFFYDNGFSQYATGADVNGRTISGSYTYWAS